MVIFSILSFLLLTVFIVTSSLMFNQIPSSYSAFSTMWKDKFESINVWSIITFLVAFLMAPPMVQAGEGDYLQCLGFFAPLYLVVVALTPNWESNKTQHIIHTVGAIICALAALAWIILIQGLFWVVMICLAVVVIAGCWTSTLRRCVVFWGEVLLFLSVYLAIWIKL